MSASPERLEVRHPGGSYPVWVGAEALERGLEEIAELWRAATVFVLSSPTVRGHHGEWLKSALHGATQVALEVPDGESAKSLAQAQGLWRKMLIAGGKRDSVLICLGGGSVGDLGGFVAGTFLRGISSVQVPTTLLAQVDASVGGKTAIDLPEGKNSVGLFHQPAAVLADARPLGTLPPGELRAGLFEVVKMAALLDLELLSLVEDTLRSLVAGDPAALTPVVAGAVRAKAAVVAEDPFEGDRRRLLNFGHTLAHGLEMALDYRGLRHGEAVGYGMLFALGLAEQRGMAHDQAERLRELIRRIGLPPLPRVDPKRVVAAMRRDKKARESGLVWVLPTALGVGTFVEDIGEQAIAARLQSFLADPGL